MNRRNALRSLPFITGAACLLRPRSALAEPLASPYGWPALPGEPLALVYPRRIRELLAKVRASSSDAILESANAIARAVERGYTCWSIWDQGHTYNSDMFPDRWGLPAFITPGYDPQKARKGDVFLAGYPFPPSHLEDAKSKGILVIGAPTPVGGDVPGIEMATRDAIRFRIRPFADIWIETETDIVGAQVRIPGSYAPLGPESGPLMGTIFWMIVSDACRLLAQAGRSFPVSGDEPELPQNSVWKTSDRPLMGEYFDTVMRGLELIGSELGEIGNISSMAVDTLLKGGTVYFYSRYPQSFASEATGRRGGFAFARALSDGKPPGTDRDCVIMGTYAPDDPADIANLSKFRAAGMRAASVGPVTRGGKIPAGDTVFRNTEAHAGRMIDTFGLFAVPGFTRKVCPVSGVLATSILWSVCADIADTIIERTGNTPGIFFNGAIAWDGWWDAQIDAMVKTRGY